MSGGLTWNPNGSLRNVAINDSTPGGTGTITCSYSTDDLNRLSSVDCPHSWGQNFTYDPFGNIRKDQNGVPGEQTLTYQAHYDAHNQVISGPVASYDPNGNQTAITPSTDLQWDAAGRLVAVDIASFRPIYDAFGRVAEVYNDGNSGYDSTFAQYVYDPSGSKIAIVSSGALVKGTVALPGGGTAIYGPNGFSHFRHTDWLGSSRLATNWDHTVHGKQTYAPFGEAYSESGTADRSFTGQDQDTISNMYDFPARRYDAVAGRFMSPDPSGLQYADIENPQSLNLYGYVRNSPMTSTDPTGLYDCDVSGDPYEPVYCPPEPGDSSDQQGIYTLKLYAYACVNACSWGDLPVSWSNISQLQQLNTPLPNPAPQSWMMFGQNNSTPKPPAPKKDVPLDYDIFHCQGCPQTWTTANTAVTTVTEGAVVAYAAAPLLAEAAGTAAGDALFARGSGLLNSTTF